MSLRACGDDAPGCLDAADRRRWHKVQQDWLLADRLACLLVREILPRIFDGFQVQRSALDGNPPGGQEIEEIVVGQAELRRGLTRGHLPGLPNGQYGTPA